MKKLIAMVLLLVVMFISSCNILGSNEIDFSTLSVDLSGVKYLGTSSDLESAKKASTTNNVYAATETERLVAIDEEGKVSVVDFFNEDGVIVEVDYNLFYFEVRENFTFAFYYLQDNYEDAIGDRNGLINDSAFSNNIQGHLYSNFLNASHLYQTMLGSMISSSVEGAEYQAIIIHNDTGKIFDFSKVLSEKLSSYGDDRIISPEVRKILVLQDEFYLEYVTETSNFDHFVFNYETNELEVKQFSTEVEILPIFITSDGALGYSYNNDSYLMLNDLETFVNIDGIGTQTPIVEWNDSIYIILESSIRKYNQQFELLHNAENIYYDELTQETYMSSFNGVILHQNDQYVYMLFETSIIEIDLDLYTMNVIYKQDAAIQYFTIIGDNVFALFQEEIIKYNFTDRETSSLYSGNIVLRNNEIVDMSYINFQITNNLSITNASINVVTGEIYVGDEVKPVVQVTSVQPIN